MNSLKEVIHKNKLFISIQTITQDSEWVDMSCFKYWYVFRALELLNIRSVD